VNLLTRNTRSSRKWLKNALVQVLAWILNRPHIW
jgi:hypothetical protein